MAYQFLFLISRLLICPLLVQAAAESDPCHQRKCTANEHCCDGTVCVDTTNGGTRVYKSLKNVHPKICIYGEGPTGVESAC